MRSPARQRKRRTSTDFVALSGFRETRSMFTRATTEAMRERRRRPRDGAMTSSRWDLNFRHQRVVPHGVLDSFQLVSGEHATPRTGLSRARMHTMLSNDADILTMRNKFTSECLGAGIQESSVNSLFVLAGFCHGIKCLSAFRRFFCRFNMAYLNYEALTRCISGAVRFSRLASGEWRRTCWRPWLQVSRDLGAFR